MCYKKSWLEVLKCTCQVQGQCTFKCQNVNETLDCSLCSFLKVWATVEQRDGCQRKKFQEKYSLLRYEPFERALDLGA